MRSEESRPAQQLVVKSRNKIICSNAYNFFTNFFLFFCLLNIHFMLPWTTFFFRIITSMGRSQLYAQKDDTCTCFAVHWVLHWTDHCWLFISSSDLLGEYCRIDSSGWRFFWGTSRLQESDYTGEIKLSACWLRNMAPKLGVCTYYHEY